MELIDFTNSKSLICDYGGSEKKMKIEYNNHNYLLKFPDPVRDKNNNLLYMNNVYSEYIGSSIFKICKITVQDVILGKFYDTKEKIVVACKDFTTKDNYLVEFATLINSITKIDRKFTTDIKDIYDAILNLDYDCNKEDLINAFWDTFVIDTLIGNTDRHLSNFGYLTDGSVLKPAPVYDCGSSLNPLLEENNMEKSLTDEALFKNLAYNLYPVYRYNGKRLTYKEFYQENITDLNKALKRVYKNIDMAKINTLIDDTPMSNVRKEYFKKSIDYRKKYILDIAFKNVMNQK